MPEWEEITAVAAVQNMWLTCHALGVGAYWSSPPLISHMNEFIEMVEGESCMGIFYMGHRSEDQSLPKRDLIHGKVEWIID